jgi:hypothetical protein
MPAIVWVIAGTVVLVVALLAVDWFWAGRTKGRLLVRAKDQSSGDTGVGYAAIEDQGRFDQYQGGTGL